MTWVLILAVIACNSGCGVSVAQIEFDTPGACENAREVIIATQRETSVYPLARFATLVCVPRSLK